MATAVMVTGWRLSELMARHSVSGKELADELGISTNAVSALKSAKTMPRINGERLDQIAAALTRLSRIDEKVRGIDLLEDRSNDQQHP